MIIIVYSALTIDRVCLKIFITIYNPGHTVAAGGERREGKGRGKR